MKNKLATIIFVAVFLIVVASLCTSIFGAYYELQNDCVDYINSQATMITDAV